MPGFKTFLLQYKDEDSPRGDFAYDVSRSNDYPNDNQTYERLFDYFETKAIKHNNPAVLRLFKSTWKKYQSSI